MALHSIVIPAYNEQEIIQDTFIRLAKEFPDTNENSFEFIFVNDGSSDQTSIFLDLQNQKDSRFKAVHLSRNFGHQVALTAGIAATTGITVSVLDSDLQDPPELIHKFIELWREGYDVIFGIRQARKGQGWLKLGTAFVFYRLLRLISKVDLPIDVGDFRLMDRKVVNAYLQCGEQHRYFRGLISWVGFKQIGIPYIRQPRLKGTTKYPLFKMLRFARDGFTSFSFLPLRLASYLGFLLSISALIGIAYIIKGKIDNHTIPGWASVMVVLLILSSVQLFSLGVLGEYLGRVLDEVRGRPLYFVARKTGLD